VAQCGHDVFAHWAKLGQKLYLEARLQLIDGDGRPLKVCGKPHWTAGNPKALNADNSDLSVDQGTESLAIISRRAIPRCLDFVKDLL
jgi:hypothetical protein